MPGAMRPGDVLVERYRLIDLLNDARGARFWLGWDSVLARHIALHIIEETDSRADDLRDAARRSAAIHDPRMLRVLDIGTVDGLCYVVNEWGQGPSLNRMVADEPLSPRRAAWLVGEVAEFVANAHAQDIAHGRLVPENVMIDDTGAVKVIGFAVDAALHGLPMGRVQTEVLDLAGILYTALTGKWAGPSKSSVDSAPQEQGRVLRPRQVRAGVPRVLDSLCDEVLSPFSGPHDHGYDSAAAIATALMEYVGDPAAMAEAEVERNRGNTSPRLPKIEALILAPDPEPSPEPDPEPSPEPDPGPSPEPDPEPEPEPEPAEPPETPKVTEETVAGTPVFFDAIEDVGWLDKDSHPEPAPPPPFEKAPTKPLFAPDPPNGAPARTSRSGHSTTTDSGTHWPWGDRINAPPPAVEVEKAEKRPIPGRSWMRIASVIGISLLMLVVLVYAFNRGSDDTTPASDSDSDEPSSSPSAAGEEPSVLEIVGISDLDPGGDPPEENPDQVDAAIDGDASTSWETMTYLQQFGPGGLKDGVGLVVDLDTDKPVSDINLRVPGGATEISIYLGEDGDPPSDIKGLTRVARGTSVGGKLDLEAIDDASGRWVVVWITALPDEMKAQIAEIQVLG